MASLSIVIDGSPQRFTLENAAVTLGRGLESDIRLKDIKASRRHCQVVRTARGFQCVDLSSGNGTYVNGVQIKSQMLSHGDKITIGSTTITFEEAAPAVKPATSKQVSTKAPTGKLPVVPPAPAAATPKAAPAKEATERVGVEPTRRSTAKLDPVRPSSKSGLKPATQPLSKSASRVHRNTGRSASARPSRPAGEPAKKPFPLLWVGAAALVLVLLGGAAYLLVSSKDSSEQTRITIESLMKKAQDAEAREHYDLAVQEYRKALELCQGDRFKVRASEIQKNLQQIESRSAVGAPAPVKRDPAPEKPPDFQARRGEISGKYKLTGDLSLADWSGAIKEWTEFCKSKANVDLKGKAEIEIRTLQGQAKEDVARLRKRAESLAQENKMAEALDLLKQQLSRFEGTDSQPELETAIKQYDR